MRPRKPIRSEPKRCTVCKIVKPIDQFYFNLNANGRKYPNGQCGDCSNKASKSKYATTEGRAIVKSNAMKRKYGITQAQYDAIFAAQQGLCAICCKPETSTRNGVVLPLVIDHNHITGMVRALLCACCNAGLGFFKDNPSLLRAAALYIDSFHENTDQLG